MLLLRFNLVQTVAFACFLFALGVYLYNYFHLESDINIPPVIIGGTIFIIARIILKGKINFEFDFTFFEICSTIFFTIIGFGITIDFLKQAKTEVFRLLLSATGLLIVQNILAIFLGKALGLSPLISFMTGSAALTGGAGTASAVASSLEPYTKTQGLMEIGIAFSSLGVLFASLFVTPFCTKIIEKKNLFSTKNPKPQNTRIIKNLFLNETHTKITLENILMTIFQICFIAGIAITLSNYLEACNVYVPSILIAVFLAICLRGLFDKIFKAQVSPRLLRFFADFNLMLLLALSIMSIDLQHLHSLSIPLFIIFTTQILTTFAWCYFVTYRLMGANYKGAVAMAGHLGFGIGIAENALVNVENLSKLYEPNPEIAFATFVVGAFLINIVNINFLYLLFKLTF